MTPLRAPTLLASLAVTASACGGPFLFADVEAGKVCITQQGIAVPGAPLGGSVSSPAFAVDLRNQIPLLPTDSSDTDLRVDEVTITPVQGSPNLEGITLAVLQVQPASGAAVKLAEYQPDPAAPAPSELVLVGDAGAGNLTQYLDSGRANLRFSLSGQPPRATWTADVKTCLHGHSHVSP